MANTTEKATPLNVVWLIFFRVCFLVTILISAFLIVVRSPNSTAEIWIITWPIALVLGFSLFSSSLLKIFGNSRAFTYLQLVVDILVVTAIVYLTGGPISPFLFLYILVVMAAAILLSQSDSLVVAAIAQIFYMTLLFCLNSRILLSADGSAALVLPSSGLALQLIGMASAMVLVGLATSYLVRKLEVSNLLVQKSKEELSEADTRQRAMLDEISESLILTNTEDQVLFVNKQACELLRIEIADAVGKNLLAMLWEIDPRFDREKNGRLGIKVQREFGIGAAEDAKRIIFHGRPLYSQRGQHTSSLYVFQDITRLRSIEEQLRLQERMAELLADQNQGPGLSTSCINNFVGESLVMQKVFQLIQKVAPSDATILISGESGTGKELVAKAIHKSSSRADAAFIAVNCGAIPETLIEGELFGHKKGSFTGAHADHAGLFRQAEGGTLFLDEIGELPIMMQAKLLRVIQEKVVRPIGAERDLPVNVRIIAATNRNLKDETVKGTFREDLYYRLNVIGIALPPLRDRKEDIPVLVKTILTNLTNGERRVMVAPAAMNLLLSYDYPGNVRELENILERSVVIGGELILPEHLPLNLREGNQENISKGQQLTTIVETDLQFPLNLEQFLDGIEKSYLIKALDQTGGAKKKAAELLGINFRSFRYRLQKFGMD